MLRDEPFVVKETVRPVPDSLDVNMSPLVVFYEVTQACDLVCQHCRACAQRGDIPKRWPPNKLKD